MSDWVEVPIESLLEKSFPGEWGREPLGDASDSIVFRGADFNQSGWLPIDAGVPRCISADKLKKIALRPGDILLEKSGGSPDQPVGRVSIFQGARCEATSSNFLQTLRPAKGVDAKFLFYLLQFEYRNGRVLAFQQQTTGLINFQLKDYLKEVVSIPNNEEEQRGIAEVLSALDEQIEATENLVNKFDATRTGLVRDLLAEINDSPRRPLIELADVGSGITLGREFSGTGTAEYPYLRVANVQDGRLDLGDVKTIRIPITNAEKVMLQPGDVLMNEGGDFDKLGRGAVWEGQIPNCLHQNHVFRVRCDQSKLLPGFLSLWAASDFGKRFFILASKQSTNLASINSTQLKSFPVLAPSVEKQREILDAVEAIDAIQAQNKAEVSKLRLKKQGLMRDLLTGAVRVTEVN